MMQSMEFAPVSKSLHIAVQKSWSVEQTRKCIRIVLILKRWFSIYINHAWVHGYSQHISCYGVLHPDHVERKPTRNTQQSLLVQEIKKNCNLRACIAVYNEIKEPVFFDILFNYIIYQVIQRSGKLSYASLSYVCSPRLRKYIIMWPLTWRRDVSSQHRSLIYKEVNFFLYQSKHSVVMSIYVE